MNPTKENLLVQNIKQEKVKEREIRPGKMQASSFAINNASLKHSVACFINIIYFYGQLCYLIILISVPRAAGEGAANI